MKCAWIKYFPIAGILLFFSCKNNGNNIPASSADPVFSSDPRLKNITDQINKSPKDAALYFERGHMLQKIKLDTLALKDYKTAATLDTSQAQYFSAIGDLLFENKDVTGSIEWIKKAIAKNPEDPKAHLKIAKLFLCLKDYPHSFGEINIALRHNPHNAEGYFLKGMVYKDMKDTAQAMSSFETSRQEDPDYRDAIIQLGLLYSAKNNPIALKYFDDAYNKDSTDVMPIFAKGVFYQNNKEDAKAKEEYKKCILRNNHYIEAFFNMGYMLMQEDSVEKSYRQYDIVTKISPLNAAAYFNRGLCNEMMNKPKEAVADYRQAHGLDTAYDRPKEALKRLGVR